MFFKRKAQEKRDKVEVQQEKENDLRQQMYERIAQSNALAEAEESARQKWRSR